MPAPVLTAPLTTSLCQHLSRPRSQGTPIVCAEIALAGSWGSHGRLDVATLAWGPNYTTTIDGFEVKVSRQDFTRDLDQGKYQKYLPSLDRLFFAAPKGLIRKEELPPGIGLIVWNPDGDSWSVVKRADRNHDRQDTGQHLRMLRRLADDHRHLQRDLDGVEPLRRLGRMFDHAQDLDRMERLGGWWLSHEVRDRFRRVADREREVERALDHARQQAAQIVATAERRAQHSDRLGPSVDLLRKVADIISSEMAGTTGSGRWALPPAAQALDAIRAISRD